ncbi:MAG: hypothetical protein P8100_12690 [bacterium]|jgi:hypothetical protein
MNSYKWILSLLLLLHFPLYHASAQDAGEDFNTWTVKGRDFLGLNFSVAHQEGTNVNRLVTNYTDLYSLDWAVRMYGGHFIKDNMTLGVLFEWDQKTEDRTYEQDGKTIQTHLFSRTFLAGPTFRSYLPLSKNNRVGIFNEANLLFGYGKSVEQSDDGSEISRGISNSYNLRLGLTPGINFFISQGWAFELSLALLGLETQVTTSDVDGVESRVTSNDVNFSVNILSLKLGVTKYF